MTFLTFTIPYVSTAHWSSYAKLGSSNLAEGGPIIFPRASARDELRDWLSKNSVLYSVASETPLFSFHRERIFAAMAQDRSLRVIVYRDAKHHVIFNLDPHIRGLRYARPAHTSGIRDHTVYPF